MPQVREKGTEAAGAEISDDDVHFLRTRLETLTPEAVLFYIDAPTIQILAEDHAPSLLMNRLREILNKRDCVDVELLSCQPPNEDEIAGLIDRRERREKAEAEANLLAAEGAATATPATAQQGATAENPAPSVDEDSAADEVTVNDKPLKCVVCKGTHFYHRAANMPWLGASTECYICSECGYVHWFVT